MQVHPLTEAITDKQTLVIDEQSYQITAVGEEVLTNLVTLGPVSYTLQTLPTTISPCTSA
ncbi:PTS glucitol/sorbitol transporter subunit IIA, partial [Enterococcus faecalis]|uniref:PTS glucitol/sorbitol transporter subunit IIA n=1 Tax=Enterococcus faecalis TaxID=1351 RepID=UPI003CC611AB